MMELMKLSARVHCAQCRVGMAAHAPRRYYVGNQRMCERCWVRWFERRAMARLAA